MVDLNYIDFFSRSDAKGLLETPDVFSTIRKIYPVQTQNKAQNDSIEVLVDDVLQIVDVTHGRISTAVPATKPRDVLDVGASSPYDL